MPTPNLDGLVNAIAGKLTHTVNYSRKVSVRQYESAEASIFIQFSTDRDASAEEIIAGANESFLQAKGIVFAQLNLDADLDETGILLELVDQNFGPGVERVNKPAKAKPALPAGSQVVPDVTGADVSGGVPANPPFDGRTKVPAEKKANREWAAKHFAAYPELWKDQRAAKAAGEIHEKSPDYKHEASGVGYWLPDAA